MPLSNAARFATQGMSTPLAKVVGDAIATGAGAPIASPTFTGVPAAPTAGVGTSTTQIATTAFVQAATKSKTQIVAITNLTDSTAGTPGATLTAIPAAVSSVGTDTTAATTVSVNASLAILRNDLASLNAQINVLTAALKA